MRLYLRSYDRINSLVQVPFYLTLYTTNTFLVANTFMVCNWLYLNTNSPHLIGEVSSLIIGTDTKKKVFTICSKNMS